MGTYSFMQAYAAVAGSAVERNVDLQVQSLACNMALNLIWKAYPWRESIADLPPFYLVPLVQLYGAPTVSVPSDFLGLDKAYYVNMRNAINSIPQTFSVTCIMSVDTTAVVGEPKVIGYEPSARAFKINPAPPPGYAAPYHMITGEYKTVPKVTLISDGSTVSKITPSNMSNAYLPFDDMYFNVWIEALKWSLWAVTSDKRAGGVQTASSGSKTYYGQMAVAMAAIDDMAENEQKELGPPVVAPRESLLGIMPFGGSSW